jgi:hypothetical protein
VIVCSSNVYRSAADTVKEEVGSSGERLLWSGRPDDGSTFPPGCAPFHDRLTRAGHLRPDTTCAGKEWFLTNVDFLDGIAGELGLNVKIVNNP